MHIQVAEKKTETRWKEVWGFELVLIHVYGSHDEYRLNTRSIDFDIESN
jgi:hypothetical protein